MAVVCSYCTFLGEHIDEDVVGRQSSDRRGGLHGLDGSPWRLGTCQTDKKHSYKINCAKTEYFQTCLRPPLLVNTTNLVFNFKGEVLENFY